MSDSSNKKFSQLNIVIGIFLIVVVVQVVLIFNKASEGYSRFMSGVNPATGDVASRIRPIVTLDDIMVADTATASMETVAKSGKQLFDGACMACHATGVAGAPKTDDTAAWEPRLAKGMDALLSSATAGIGAMPPKGGSAYNEDQMKSAIEYILQQAGLMNASSESESMSENQSGGSESAMQNSGVDITAGEAAYKTACFACHDSGAAGAPKLGDSAAWANRIALGNDALSSAAISGKGAMPPKGGAAHLSDDEVRNIVAFMVSKSQ